MQKWVQKSTVLDYDGSGIITVAANVFGNVDADGDISLPGSYAKTIKENFHRMRWLKNHNRGLLLGVPLKAEETPDYLKVRGQINLKKELGRDTYADYVLYAEHGLSLEHSVGVEPILYEIDNANEVRRVREWKWWEYSTLDTWGANDEATTIDIKQMDAIAYIQKMNVLDIKLHKGNYTDETFMQIEKSITNIKSLLAKSLQPNILKQPVPADVLADVTKNFLLTLETN